MRAGAGRRERSDRYGQRRRLSRGLAAVGAVGALVVLGGCGGDSAHEFVGYLQRPVDVGAIELPDLANGGAPMPLRAEPDGVLLVYFGFTSCPDYCPTSLNSAGRAIAELGEAGDRVSVALVSVDPERDADVIVEYVGSFVAGGHALLTDDLPLLGSTIATFGGSFVPAVDGGDPDHTLHMYGVNDEGQAVITWTVEMIAGGDLADDLAALLDGDGYRGLAADDPAAP